MPSSCPGTLLSSIYQPACDLADGEVSLCSLCPVVTRCNISASNSPLHQASVMPNRFHQIEYSMKLQLSTSLHASKVFHICLDDHALALELYIKAGMSMAEQVSRQCRLLSGNTLNLRLFTKSKGLKVRGVLSCSCNTMHSRPTCYLQKHCQ